MTGGTSTGPNGTIQLSVPAGAVSVPTLVYLDPVDAPPTDPNPGIPGTAFMLGPPMLALRVPAALGIHYAAGAVTALLEGSIGMYSRDGTSLEAVNGSTLDQSTRLVTAPVTLAGTYGLLAPGPVAWLTLSPRGTLVIVGTTGTRTATLTDTTGVVLTNRPIAWRSGDTTVAQVDQHGVVFGRDVGLTFVSAWSGGASGSSTIFVAIICSCPSAPAVRLPKPRRGLATTHEAGRVLALTAGTSCACAQSP